MVHTLPGGWLQVVSHSSILGFILFNIFMSDLEKEAEVTLVKYSVDTNLGWTVNSRTAIQRQTKKSWRNY